MDFLGWSFLVIASLWVSALAFCWALKSGQFSDPERARYLALPEDLPPAPAELPAARRSVNWSLAAVCTLTLLSGAAALLLTVWHHRG